jgi:hypothetical protein
MGMLLVAVFILPQRYWQSGLSAGAVRELQKGSHTPVPHLPKVLFGAAYYHEYQRGEHLETDLDLMADVGFSVIRVGESVWSTWEPENGQFNLGWLQPVLDGAHRRGCGVQEVRLACEHLGSCGIPTAGSAGPVV